MRTMRLRGAILVGLTLVGSVAVPGTAAKRRGDLDTDRARYLPGRKVVVTLENRSEERLRFAKRWRIKHAKSNEVVASLEWAPDERWVPPHGGEAKWYWDQSKGYCGGTGCTYDPAAELGANVGPGRYIAVVRTEDGVRRTSFEIGRYFTIGFDAQVTEETFVVFSRDRRAIRQMKDQLKMPEEERWIVSGIVRKRAKYNRPWSYTMGTGTIVLGEAFIEVCDASPRYVEENQSDWMGQRWCPWSSFVARAGR